MRHKKFIEDPADVQDALDSWELDQSETVLHRTIYVDPKSRNKWEKYEFEWEGEPLFRIGLRRFPYPSIGETIQIALYSKFEDEVAGAAALLYEYDRQGQDVREPLLNSIEQVIHDISRDRFEAIYWRSEIFDPTNNRDVKGKSIGEIEADANHYRETATRAKALHARIIAAAGV